MFEPKVRVSNWAVMDETSPSGKVLFKCVICGRISTTPDKMCGPHGERNCYADVLIRQAQTEAVLKRRRP